MNSVNSMILIFLGITLASLTVAYISMFLKLRRSNLMLAKLFIENERLKDLRTKTDAVQITEDDLIHKENFIKFLSDSRDWAFEYIETSQKTIEEVSKELKNIGLNEQSDRLTKLLPDVEIR